MRRNELIKLAHARNGLASPALDSFDQVPVAFAAAVLQIISDLLPVRDFPLLPDDELWAVLDIEQGTLESDLEDFLERVAPSAPPLAKSAQIREPKTVRDLIAMTYAHAKPFLASG